MKYVPDFPHHFDSLAEAKAFCDGFFTKYNHVHHLSGIGWHTPASVHFGTYQDIDDARTQSLNRVYREHPERFNQPPRPPQIRHEAWTDEPAKEETATIETTKTVSTRPVSPDLTNSASPALSSSSNTTSGRALRRCLSEGSMRQLEAFNDALTDANAGTLTGVIHIPELTAA